MDSSRVEGRNLIVVDDIHITGASQRKFLELLNQLSLKSLIVIFLCKMRASDAKNPGIEGVLNHKKVKYIKDLYEIAAAGALKWNIRVVKFILESSDHMSVETFLSCLTDELLESFYYATIANDYHFEEKYKMNLHIARSLVTKRGLI